MRILVFCKIADIKFIIRALSILGQATNIPTDLYLGISLHPEEDDIEV
jgi:hypothetical protein